MLDPISAFFLLKKTSLSLPELQWALDRGIIGAKTVVDWARSMVAEGSEDPSVRELAAIQDVDLASVAEMLRRVPQPNPSDDESRHKWVWLTLSWVYDRHHAEPDVFATLDALYADLGYPDEMMPFGPHAPAYQSKEDPEEIRRKLLLEWRRYLAQGQAVFGQAR
jgi:hypothetical protein